MSAHGRTYGRRVQAAAAIAQADIGKACYINGSDKLAIADDGADQGANQALALVGVITESAAADDYTEFQTGGTFDSAIAGTGGVSEGDYVVAEVSTGKWITLDPEVLDTGANYVGGFAESDADADGTFRLNLDKAFVVVADGERGTSATLAMGDAAATFTDAQHLVEFLDVDPESTGASETLTTRTAAQLISAGVVSASKRVRRQIIYNSGGEHVTLAGGSGVTLTSAGADLVIEDGEIAELVYTYIGAGDVRCLLINDGA